MSRIVAAAPFPPVELAERLVRVTPGDLATLSIEWLGKAALPLLAVGVIAMLLAVGTALAPRPVVTAAALYAIVLAAAGLAGPRSASLVLTLASVALATLAYALALRFLPGDAGRRAAGEGATPRVTRRRALLTAGGTLAALLGAGGVLNALADRARSFRLRAPDEPARVPARVALPAVEGRPPELTPAADHYVVDIDLVDPALDAGTWALEVGGEVDRPLRLGVEDLQREFTLVEQVSALTCISNEVGGPLVGSSRWTGVRLADVLRRAGVRPGAGELAFRCADGYTSALSIEQAGDPAVLLAIAQEGRPLTREHGFPCRLRVPALYGMKNPKWIEGIEVRRARLEAYWVRRGWSDAAVVRTSSRIDVAPDARAGQPVWLAGVAWAGDRRISAVELSFDGGRSWRRARTQAPLSPVAWTQWAYRHVPERSGVQTVSCRAVDGEGRAQEARERPPHPSGATGYHELSFQVT